MAARTQRANLSGDAALLAEDHATFNSARWRRNVAASGHQASDIMLSRLSAEDFSRSDSIQRWTAWWLRLR